MRSIIAAITFGLIAASPAMAGAQTTSRAGAAALPGPVVLAQTTPGPLAQAYPRGYRYGRYRADWQNPYVFARRVRAQMFDIERELRRDIRQGDVHPFAARQLERRQRRAEQMLSQFSADGFISAGERRSMMRTLRNMSQIEERFDRDRYGRGGGPRGWRR